jgi:hypothetical protein
MQRRRCSSFRLALLVGSLGATAACGPQIVGNPLPPPEEPPTISANPMPDSDLDGDGYLAWADGDCDDDNADVHPGADENCDDGIDNNCDGVVDEEDERCLVDNDGDGVPSAKDCNDDDATIYPGAEEVCDGVDNDCSGIVDDTLTDDCVPAIDADGDGWLSTEDCDDSSAEIHPGAGEDCEDLVDNDCDGLVDWEDAECDVILNG